MAFGTRISEESHHRLKPGVEVGGKPILWHILNIYSHYGIKNFLIWSAPVLPDTPASGFVPE